MNKQKKKRGVLKAIAVLITVAMLAVPVSAADNALGSYVCLGDHIANGATAEDPEGTIMEVKGFGSVNHPQYAGYYKDVAKKLGISSAVSYAHNGYRAAEVRALFDDSFAKENEKDAYNKEILGNLSSLIGMEFRLGYIDDLTADVQKKVREDVAKGGLVTLQVGSIDILVRPVVDVVNNLSLADVARVLKSAGLSITDLTKMLESGDLDPDAVAALMKAVCSDNGILNKWDTGRSAAVKKFKTDLEAAIKKINDLSGGKSTVVLPSLYLKTATFEKLNILGIDCSDFAKEKRVMKSIEESTAEVNNIMKSMASKYSYVKYADISGVATDTLIHPVYGVKGYGYIADKIAGAFAPKAASLSKVTAGKKAFTAAWKKQSSAEGYQLQYALKSSFSGAKTVKIKKNSTVKYTVKKLKAKKKYYVRIRTYKGSVYSAWSKAKTVTTKK